MSECKAEACKAEIVFARTENGKTMPFDAEPSPDGKWQLRTVAIAGGVELEARFVRQPVMAVEDDALPGLYMPHHATCKDVEAFRR